MPLILFFPVRSEARSDEGRATVVLRLTRFRRAVIISAAGALISASFTPAADTTQMTRYLQDIQAGPSTFYTPEAYAYFVSRNTITLGGAATDRDAAARSFSAITRISHLSFADARLAIPIMVSLFPKVVHLVQVRGAVFGPNEGTIDDCIGTCVTNAKNQFIVSPPVLDYNIISQYESFMDESHEVEFISKQLNASGEVVEAQFNLKIFFTIYIGEGALSRLTGQSLGHDQNAWKRWETGSAGEPPPSGVHYAMSAGIAPATGWIAAPPGQSAPVVAVPSPQLVQGKSYRLFLTTGNDLRGKVVTKDSASVTLLTVEGKPYVVDFALIKNVAPLELPTGPASP